MRRWVSSSVPSWQISSAEPRGRFKLPAEGYWPGKLFESIYCSVFSTSAKPSFFLVILEEGGWLLHTALCLQVCICSGPKWHWAQTLSGLFLWVVWAHAILWWNNCFSAARLKSHFQNVPVFPEYLCWSASEEGLASSYMYNIWDRRTFMCSLLSITESRAGQGEVRRTGDSCGRLRQLI